MTFIIATVSAMVVFMLISGVISLFTAGRDEAEQRVRERMKVVASGEEMIQEVALVNRQAMSDVAWFNKLLEQFQWASNFRLTMSRGKVAGAPSIYLLMSGLLGVTGFYFTYTIAGALLGAIIIGMLFGSIPILYVKRKANKRMFRFQEQLPDALDLLARALKAGHTFTGGMRMVADEFADPIGPEFGQTLDEMNYGLDPDKALNNLLHRVDCPDLKFFAVSVNIQRETGGNLAEIVSGIAALVRGRFMLLGKVQVLAAEGKLSAYVLLALPFIICLVLYLINPGYMGLLFERELGRQIAMGALVSMCIGALVIRNMIKIKM